MGSPFVQLHLTLVTLIGRGQGHSDFEALYLVKEQSQTHKYHAESEFITKAEDPESKEYITMVGLDCRS